MHNTLSRARLFAMLLAAALMTPVAAHDAESSAAVRSVWTSIDATWNARDAERFSRLFAEDVSFVLVQRKHALEGRAAVYEEFARRFPNFAVDVRHSTVIHEIRAIAPDVFAVDGTVEILRVKPDAQATVMRTFAIFAIMVPAGENIEIRTLRIYELPTESGN